MQRPSDELFDSTDLIGNFSRSRITAVINLTEPGEHPFCGYPLKASGFPYSPERLMSSGSIETQSFLFFLIFFLLLI
jgi:hypothetical protein